MPAAAFGILGVFKDFKDFRDSRAFKDFKVLKDSKNSKDLKDSQKLKAKSNHCVRYLSRLLLIFWSHMKPMQLQKRTSVIWLSSMYLMMFFLK